MTPEIIHRDGRFFMQLLEGEKEITAEEVQKYIAFGQGLLRRLEQGKKYTENSNWAVGESPKEFDSIVEIDILIEDLARSIEIGYEKATDKKEYLVLTIRGLKQFYFQANKQLKNPLLIHRRNIDEYYKAQIEWLLASWEGVKYSTSTDEIEQKIKRFIEYFKDNDFYTLALVSSLAPKNQNKLLKTIISNDSPYVIAMFNHLGFTEILEQRFLKKIELHKSLSELLNINTREIKGLINVTKPNSKESTERYTTLEYKELVITDYQNLK